MAPVTPKATSVEAAYNISMTWEVELDLNDFPEESTFPLEGTSPLTGDWTLILRQGSDAHAVEANFRHGKVPAGAFGRRVRTTAWFSYILEGERITISRFTWVGDDGKRCPQPEENESGGVFIGFDLKVERYEVERAARLSDGSYDPKTHRRYACTMRVDQDFPNSDEPAFPPAGSEEKAMLLAGLHNKQLPHDVRLYFPSASGKEGELWANSDVLSRSSPYLKDLLSSDFAESKPRRSKRARVGGVAEVDLGAGEAVEKDYPDSDDETDTFLFSKQPQRLEQSSEADEVSYRQIVIKQTAFSTYHAVLVYLQTGFIHFTPLSSSFPSADFTTRNDFLAKSLTDKPTFPLPVSSKSVYRLAHLLRLSALQTQCLAEIKSSLTASAVASELFSDMSIAYDDFRRILIDFVLGNLDDVRRSASWKLETARMKQEDPVNAMAILLELFEAQDADDADKGGSDSSASED